MGSDYEVVIAGGGIAGLTAGTVSARLGRKTLILIGDMLGGNLLSIEKIEGYPGFPDGVAGYELCPTVQAQAAEAGAKFSMTALDALDPVPNGWRVSSAGQDYAADAVILATGTSLMELGVPGETRLVGSIILSLCNLSAVECKTVLAQVGGLTGC